MTSSTVLSILILATISPAITAAWPTLFQHWYMRYQPPWPDLIAGECRPEYEEYLSYDGTCPNRPGTCLNIIVAAIADCLLNKTPENTKANMAAASVLLGLLPTILSMAGSSTVEVGLLALRRPLLALLLGTASPAVNPLRTFDYGNPASLMSREQHSVTPSAIPTRLGHVLSGLQYAVALAAMANLALVTYELSIRTYSVGFQYVPIVLMWVCLAVFIHVMGAVALRFRVKLTAEEEQKRLGAVNAATLLLKNEFVLSAHHAPGGSRLVFQPESFCFVILSWATSVATIIHIAMGTMVLSSLLFINTQDATFVATRCLGSACVCRVIVMFELSYMRTNVHVDEDDHNNDIEQKHLTRFTKGKNKRLRVAAYDGGALTHEKRQYAVECRSRSVDACSIP